MILPADDRQQFEDIAVSILMTEQVQAIFGESDTPATTATRPKAQ